MRSLTQKLALIFAVMSLMLLIIGLNAGFSVQIAKDSLNANDAALKNLSGLLDSSVQSIEESTRLQDRANTVISEIAESQEEAYDSLRRMGDRMLPKTFAISQIRFSLADATSAERTLLLALNMRHLDLEELNATRELQVRNINAAIESMDGASAVFENLISTAEERAAWNSVAEALALWKNNHADFMGEIANLDALVEDLVRGGPLFASSSRRAYDTIFVRGKAARQACESRIDVLNETLARSVETNVAGAVGSQNKTQELIRNLSREFEAASHRAADLNSQVDLARMAAKNASQVSDQALAVTERRFAIVIFVVVLGVAAAAITGFVVSRRISRPVRQMVAQLVRVANGDLTEDVSPADMARGDEIGQLARAMQDVIASSRQEIGIADALAMGDYTSPVKLRSESDQLGRAMLTMLATSNDMLHRVAKTVEQVDHGAQAVSEASRSLSQGAQTSAQALEEISQTVNHVDSQAKDNAGKAREANELATASRDAARRGYDAVTHLVASMGEIQQAGTKIAKVAKLIDDIAFQTNLLALNAAVEAARAGRQGKGFSVVADEVRNLSGRSARAARETGEMVAAMIERMDEGSLLAERTDAEFRDIVEATNKVARIFQDITSASNAQSNAMAQIADGLGQIDDVVQESTHNASRTAESADLLTRQAGELRQMVSRFKLLSESERKVQRREPRRKTAPGRELDYAGRLELPMPGNGTAAPGDGGA